MATAWLCKAIEARKEQVMWQWICLCEQAQVSAYCQFALRTLFSSASPRGIGIACGRLTGRGPDAPSPTPKLKVVAISRHPLS